MFPRWLKMTEFQCCFAGAASDINMTAFIPRKRTRMDYRLLVTNTAFPSFCTRKSTLIYYQDITARHGARS